jgi:enediyne biosynthesis protein E4
LRTNSSLQFYSVANRAMEEISIPGNESIGALAVGDVNGDGQPDLFVGGRVVRGRYPEPVSSYVYLNRGGKLELDDANAAVLKSLGMVTGAVFADLDADTAPELIVSCEWGPIKVFQNDGGRLRERTRELGLDKYSGWWNDVAVGDLDGDGKLDLVASNWGRNTPYQEHLVRPLRLYYGDFNQDGRNEVIEAVFDEKLKKTVPLLDYETFAREMPFIAERYGTYRAFGAASVEELLGSQHASARFLEANSLDSMVFLNRGNRFEAKPLPVEAQFAPAFGVCVSDFDGDGKLDVFLAQNFFGVKAEQSRYDGGLGLLLRGTGGGDCAAISASQTGIRMFGEQRGCVAVDFDGDGRTDFAVAQHNGATMVYRNQWPRSE